MSHFLSVFYTVSRRSKLLAVVVYVDESIHTQTRKQPLALARIEEGVLKSLLLFEKRQSQPSKQPGCPRWYTLQRFIRRGASLQAYLT
jgi:hypothetical protein